MMMEFPKCSKCKEFPMVPLSDYGGDRGGSAAVLWKAWACLDQNCGYSIRIDNGRVTYDVITKVGVAVPRGQTTKR